LFVRADLLHAQDVDAVLLAAELEGEVFAGARHVGVGRAVVASDVLAFLDHVHGLLVLVRVREMRVRNFPIGRCRQRIDFAAIGPTGVCASALPLRWHHGWQRVRHRRVRWV